MIPGTPRDTELRDYVAVLRRQIRVVVITVVIALTVAAAWVLRESTVYRATTEVLIEPRASELIFPQTKLGRATGPERVQTEIGVMRSGSVVDAVTEVLHHRPRVEIVERGQTDIIAISAEGASAAEAAHVANTFVANYIEMQNESQINSLFDAATQVQRQLDRTAAEMQALDDPLHDLDAQIQAATTDATRQQLQAQRDTLAAQVASDRASLTKRKDFDVYQLGRLDLARRLTKTGGAQIISRAKLPANPVRPRPVRDIIAGLLVGLLVGVALAFVRDRLAHTNETEEILDLATGTERLS